MSAEINVGLVGFGAAGRFFHAPFIRATAGLRLTKVVERHSDNARKLFPDVEVVRSLDELLEDETIRLVVVATPNQTHYELVRRSLEAGRDVVVDKPFTVTSAEARELVELAARSGRLLSVYQNRRWDGDFLTVRKLIEEGALGRITRFDSRFDRWRPAPRPGAWRESEQPGGGLLWDIGPHLIDQALVLFGIPEAVTADVRVEREAARADDAFDIILHYEGFRAFLGASLLGAEPGHRFLVRGTRGSYIKYGLDPQEARLRAGRMPAGPDWGEEPPQDWGRLSVQDGDSLRQQAVPTLAGDYRRYYENIRDAISGRAEPAVTAAAAGRVMEILELARRSSLERRTLPCNAGGAS